MSRRRLHVVLVCALYRMLMGVGFAAPVAVTWAPAVGEHPRSDAVLWESGGYWLVESARMVRTQLGAPAIGGGIALFAMSMGWLLFTGALITHVGDDEADGVDMIAHALSRFAPLTILQGITFVAQVVAIGGMAWLGVRFSTPDKGGDLVRIGCGIMGLGLAALMAIGHDAARVVCVLERPGVLALINRTFERLRARPAAMLGAAAWRGGAAWGVLVGSLFVTTTLMRGGPALVGVAAVVQLVAIAGYVALRVSWFAWLARVAPSEGQTRRLRSSNRRASPSPT